MINPGSCGLPLDCIYEGIPYTILDISNNGNVIIDEKRVPFNKDEYIEILRQSDQFTKANVWSKIIIKELKAVREYMFFFLNFTEKHAIETGDYKRPYSVSTWEKAYKLWDSSFNISEYDSFALSNHTGIKKS